STCLSHHSALHASRLTRALHSFPTRRSSDLRRVALERRERGGEAGVTASHTNLTYEHRGRDVLTRGRDRHDALPAPGCGFVEPRDRKSTRLNSSHVAISYAVFCLKKKNTKDK